MRLSGVLRPENSVSQSKTGSTPDGVPVGVLLAKANPLAFAFGARVQPLGGFKSATPWPFRREGPGPCSIHPRTGVQAVHRQWSVHSVRPEQ